MLQTHDIPVGMMWVQTAVEPVDAPVGSPLYRRKLFADMNVIKNPAAVRLSHVACDRVLREDIWNAGDTIDSVISRWKAFIEAARAAGVKCSLGYVWKLFGGRPVAEINQFVDEICNIENVGDVVESWHVVDEPLTKYLDKDSIRDVVKTINDRQHLPANGSRDWPFNIVIGADKEGTSDFWPVYINDRYYNPDPQLKNYIDAIAADWPAGAGAKVIISLYYYPWASRNWSYGSLPPWRKWRYFIEKFREWYPDPATHPIHFVIEGGAANRYYSVHLAGHVDMHQQVRMARNYGAQGIWFWGWGNRDNPLSQNLQFTMTHWVNSAYHGIYVTGHAERWGEAIANEVTTAREEISIAVPKESKIVDITQVSNGFWIRYWLASRGKVEFRIHDSNNNWVKRIDLGYKNNTSKPSFSEDWANFYDSVPGRYEYMPGTDRGMGKSDYFGTAAYWNRTNNDFRPVSAGYNPYNVIMYVNGNEVGSPVQVYI